MGSKPLAYQFGGHYINSPSEVIEVVMRKNRFQLVSKFENELHQTTPTEIGVETSSGGPPTEIPALEAKA